MNNFVKNFHKFTFPHFVQTFLTLDIHTHNQCYQQTKLTILLDLLLSGFLFINPPYYY